MKKAANCFEFWFNRYQSLAGNIITAAVAALTLRWAAKQLGAADRQVAAANRQAAVAGAEALRAVAADLNKIRADLELCGSGIGKWARAADLGVEFDGSGATGLLMFHRRVDAILSSVIEVLSPLETVQLQSGDDEIFQLTERLRMRLTSVIVGAGQIRILRGSDMLTGGDGPALHSMTTIQQECRAGIEVNNEALTLIRRRVAQTWKAIRAFEDEAIGRTSGPPLKA
ncbi:hypothetical protein [Bosea sp. PAMC 26642]|uniref:hypothetical protein n=1 Tax=Bosea sp. (strain PAMC 26642) TaxID=1792307 RepID=UPI0012E7A0B9|nr:hypothetical protein [Bosea sp. PAMC 26642]